MQTGNNIRTHYGVTTNEAGGSSYGILQLWQSVNSEYNTLSPFINQQIKCLASAIQEFDYGPRNQLARTIFIDKIYTISVNINGRVINLAAIFQYCLNYLKINNYIGGNDNNYQYATVNTSEFYHARRNFKKNNRDIINNINNYYYNTLKQVRNFSAHEILPCISMLNKLIEFDENFEQLHSIMQTIHYKLVTEFQRKQYENQFFQAVQTDARTVIYNSQSNNQQGLRKAITKY